MPARPDAIMLPKCSGAADLQRLSVKLAVHEAASGATEAQPASLPSPPKPQLRSSARRSYAGASPRLSGLTWGPRTCRPISARRRAGWPTGASPRPHQLARSLTLFAACAAAVAPIDLIYQNYRDAEGLRREMRGGPARRIHRQNGHSPRPDCGHQRRLFAWMTRRWPRRTQSSPCSPRTPGQASSATKVRCSTARTLPGRDG